MPHTHAACGSAEDATYFLGQGASTHQCTCQPTPNRRQNRRERGGGGGAQTGHLVTCQFPPPCCVSRVQLPVVTGWWRGLHKPVRSIRECAAPLRHKHPNIVLCRCRRPGVQALDHTANSDQ